MTNVKIGLENKTLLKWFNQFHAALLKADSAKASHGEMTSTEERILSNKERGLHGLIPVTEAILNEMREEFADARTKIARFVDARVPSTPEIERRMRMEARRERLKQEGW